MKVKNKNISSIKTKQLIRVTYAELLYEKKSIHKITVTELVRRADINRSTFYSHYDDVYQVAEDIKNETMKAFFEDKRITDTTDIENFFDDIYKYIKKNDNLFRLMFQANEVTGFVRRLGRICKEQIYGAVKDDSNITDKRLLELEISTMSDGLAMQFIRYYHRDLDITLEDVIEYSKIWCKDMIKRRSS